MTLPRLQAITFDAAHTLFHPYPSVGSIYREVMLRHGVDLDAEALEAAFRRAFATARKDLAILDGEARERSYWRAVVLSSLEGLAPVPFNFDALFDDLWQEFARGSRWRPCPGSKETLLQLRRRGYQIALLTNWDARVRQVLAESGFDACFDHLFISSEIGAEKPDPAIFAFAQKALACPPAAILHLGDSLQHDLQGATAAGWRALRVVGDEAHPPSGHLFIRRIAELPAWLGEAS